MNRFLAYLFRLAVIMLGYIAASLATSAFLHLLFFAGAGFRPEEAPAFASASFIFSIPFVALFVAYFGFIPSVAVVLIGEVLSRRDWLYYALGGCVVAGVFLAFVNQAADPGFMIENKSIALAIAGGGIFGGIAYWATAGRWAGSWRVPRRDVTVPGPSGS